MDFSLNFIIGLLIGSLLALCEEIGWRGYMLARLGWIGPVRAMLLVGFLHGTWHLPLMLLTDLYHPGADRLIVVPLFLMTLTGAGVFYGLLRIWTGSVWPFALAHGAANAAWNLAAQSSQTTGPLTQEFLGGESGLVVIIGVTIFGAVLGKAPRRQGFESRLGVVV